MDGDRLMNPKQAAAYLGYATATLQYWRCQGGGPPYVKMNPGGHLLTPFSIRYRLSDLDAWVDSFGKRRNTSQQKADPVPSRRLRLKRFGDDIPVEVVKPPPNGSKR